MKGIRKRSCKNCKAKYQPSRSDSLFCSRLCKQQAQQQQRKQVTAKANLRRAKLIQSRMTALAKSSFGIYLASQIKRAGTAQILEGSTKEDLDSLYELKRKSTSFSGFDYSGKPRRLFHLSHIFGVEGDNQSIGKLNVRNLVIATQDYNLRRGNRAIAQKGESLKRQNISWRFKTKENMSTSSALALAHKLLKVEFEEFLLSNTFSPGIRATLLRQIQKHCSVDVNSTIEELQTIAQNLGLQIRVPPASGAEEIDVLIFELERNGHTNHWLYWIAQRLNERDLGSGPKHFASLDFKQASRPNLQKFVLEQIQNLLHKEDVNFMFEGKPVTDHFYLPYRLTDHLATMHLAMHPLDHFCLQFGRFQSKTYETEAEEFFRELEAKKWLALEWLGESTS